MIGEIWKFRGKRILLNEMNVSKLNVNKLNVNKNNAVSAQLTITQMKRAISSIKLFAMNRKISGLENVKTMVVGSGNWVIPQEFLIAFRRNCSERRGFLLNFHRG